MQKIFAHCYDLDKRCYDVYGLNEDILMEHAADGMARYIRARFEKGARVLIAAGPGNNGADGVTLARLLWSDYEVMLHLPYGAKSDMAKTQLARFEAVGGGCETFLPDRADVVVDALFGAGFDRPLDEKSVRLVERLSAMKGLRIACDIPSGLDSKGIPNPVAFEADVTLTMGALKEALFSDAAKRHTGEIEVVDLGVSRTLYEDHAESFLLEIGDFRPPYRLDPASHKGHFGHLAVVVGQMEGAARLCARAAQRMGAGLVTLVTRKKLAGLEASLMQRDGLPQGASAVAVGMGLGEADAALIEELANRPLPMVIDADLCRSPLVEKLLAKSCVITPHPKEFAALLHTVGMAEVTVEEVQADRFGWAGRFARAYPEAVLVLKGAHTVIAHRHLLYVNPLGTPVLSQGGSGDVLDGLIGGLLAQGFGPLQAAMQGSLALALAARRYRGADFSATAEDMIEEIRWIAS
ncbi:MAG: NAD(P)H-hydrate dehydratase [Epsilonproteobacteria bacterium]|nr:NAD(P)H-hydrate dehydratase [Campylobacterota bacterium]